MLRLFVNIDHVATLREARRTDEPDPVRAAVLVELAGADGITVHLRADRRHIQDRDVRVLAQTLRTPMNLELATVDDILELALEIQPHQATLVPEKRQEVSTEGGLDLSAAEARSRVGAAVKRLQDGGIRTSLFIDPDSAAIRHSAEMGAEAVELHTGEYANARPGAEAQAQVDRLRAAAKLGRELGLAVHAGHGLTYQNVLPIAAIAEIEELNIGHSMMARAILMGMDSAVRDMRALLRKART